MIALRDYQHDLVGRTRQVMRAGSRRVLIQSPTGSGKTALTAHMLANAVARGKRAWFVVHRRELLTQSARAFAESADLDVGLIAAGFPASPRAPVQVCSVQTLTKRLAGLQAPDFLVMDECHHCPSKSWQAVASACPNAYHVGLSATPQRLDGQGLGAFFDALVVGPSTEELIAQGWLSPYRLFAPSRPDVSGVHRVAGDYNKAELSSTMQASAVVGDAISHYQRHTPAARALVFAWSLDASRQIAQQFRDVGVDAAHIDGETPRFEREYQMQRFANGELRVVCNVDLFGEGLDVPALDAVFLLRPTQSLGLYLQQVGRGLRRAEGKSHVAIFDHAGNWERHGLPDDPREWSLAAKEKSKAPSEACGKRCMQCFGVARPSAKVCPYCHAPFVVQSREVARVDGSLEEIARSEGSPDELNASLNRVGHVELRRLAHQCSSLQDFQALAKRLQFKPQWAWFQWKLRERNTARYTGVGV